MKVLVTGANGFIGKALCTYLHEHGHDVVAAVRRGSGQRHEIMVGEIDKNTNWEDALAGCDAIVHLAARVHKLNDSSSGIESLYRETNTAATINLAKQAVLAGVKRFVFVSSIKVNGEGSDRAYTSSDKPNPQDAYANSKWEAEQSLKKIANESEIEVVILRPPLIYGPDVKANFLRLLHIVYRGWPLPFGLIRNRRSLLFVGNFIDVIAACLTHPNAVGKTYLVSDCYDVSISDLIKDIAFALGRPARLLPVPQVVISWISKAFGKSDVSDRIIGSLTVDCAEIESDLHWKPPYTMQQGLGLTADWYLDTLNKKYR